MNIQELFGSTPQAQVTRGKGQQELGQEDFLELLVAQMKNQDPSNPADNAQFLSQIAQFSMVDGIEGLNNSFDSIAGNFFTNQAMSASQLVGRQVLSDSSSGWLHEGRTLDGVIGIPEFADAVNVQVRDNYGKLVKTLDAGGFEAGQLPFSWDGSNEQGEPMMPGEYSVTATALVDGVSQALPVKLYNTVESITLNRTGNKVELLLDNNQLIGFSGVTEYR